MKKILHPPLKRVWKSSIRPFQFLPPTNAAPYGSDGQNSALFNTPRTSPAESPNNPKQGTVENKACKTLDKYVEPGAQITATTLQNEEVKCTKENGLIRFIFYGQLRFRRAELGTRGKNKKAKGEQARQREALDPLTHTHKHTNTQFRMSATGLI